MFVKILLTLATLSLVLPWFSTNQAAFTLSLYDFAEWVSLHPLERSAAFQLPTALLLRLQVLIIVLLWLTAIRYISRLWWLLILALCCLAQLPPIDAMAEWRDSNYLQQILIALGTFVAALLTRNIYQQEPVLLAGSVLALISATAALISAQELAAGFNLMTTLMTGVWLYFTAMLALAIYIGTLITRKKQTG